MFSRRLYTDGMRVFTLLVAISVCLLAGVAATPARSLQVAPILISLERDLAALRAQLELMPAQALDRSRPQVAFNAGIADGGAAFHWAAITTIMRSANRRLRELDGRFHDTGDGSASASVAELRTGLRMLESRLARLRTAPDRAEAAEARAQAEDTLAELERTLDDLHDPQLN